MFSFTDFRKKEIKVNWTKGQYARAAVLILHGIPQWFYGEAAYILEVQKNGSADKNLTLIFYRSFFHMLGGCVVVPMFLISNPTGIAAWGLVSLFAVIQEIYQANKSGFHLKNIIDIIAWCLPGGITLIAMH